MVAQIYVLQGGKNTPPIRCQRTLVAEGMSTVPRNQRTHRINKQRWDMHRMSSGEYKSDRREYLCDHEHNHVSIGQRFSSALQARI